MELHELYQCPARSAKGRSHFQPANQTNNDQRQMRQSGKGWAVSKTRYPFEPDYAVAPGETLREMLEALGMTQVELAVAIDVVPEKIDDIINGAEPITVELAAGLASMTQIPAKMWLKMEANYRRDLAKAAERSAKGGGVNIPYAELPRKFRSEARAYIEDGVKPGQFLELLVLKDVTGMQCAAIVDAVSGDEMLAAMRFFDNHAPPNCWGSAQRMSEWRTARAKERHK